MHGESILEVGMKGNVVIHFVNQSEVKGILGIIMGTASREWPTDRREVDERLGVCLESYLKDEMYKSVPSIHNFSKEYFCCLFELRE